MGPRRRLSLEQAEDQLGLQPGIDLHLLDEDGASAPACCGFYLHHHLPPPPPPHRGYRSEVPSGRSASSARREHRHAAETPAGVRTFLLQQFCVRRTACQQGAVPNRGSADALNSNSAESLKPRSWRGTAPVHPRVLPNFPSSRGERCRNQAISKCFCMACTMTSTCAFARHCSNWRSPIRISSSSPTAVGSVSGVGRAQRGGSLLLQPGSDGARLTCLGILIAALSTQADAAQGARSWITSNGKSYLLGQRLGPGQTRVALPSS